MPRALDLFCGAGGASRGLVDAGYEVIGVDLEPQKNYPYEFYQDDALAMLRRIMNPTAIMASELCLVNIDLIWASPPCQYFSAMKWAPKAKVDHLDLITPTRELLKQIGKPYVIENVEQARDHLIDPVLLCGSMFGLGANAKDADGTKRFFQLQRHRLFECSFPVVAQTPCDHVQPTMGIYGGHVRCRSGDNWREGGCDFPGENRKELASRAMGIDWATMLEMSQMIPPAYASHIGRAALAHQSTAPLRSS